MSVLSDLLLRDAGKAFSGIRRLCLVIAATGTLMLFYLGAQPIAVGLFRAPWDKLAHLLVFAAITGLLWIGTAGRFPLVLVAIVAGIGVADEWHQAGLPGRSMDLGDLLVDISASVLTVIVLHGRYRAIVFSQSR
jgi:VanZ family protein